MGRIYIGMKEAEGNGGGVVEVAQMDTGGELVYPGIYDKGRNQKR